MELAYLQVRKRCSHALDHLDESMLMVISSSSSGTLVLVLDKNIFEWIENMFLRTPSVGAADICGV